MILVIDAYNILKQVSHRVTVTSQERAHFVGLVTRYCLKRGHEALIVFDGGSGPRPEKFPINAQVMVIYAGHAQNADQVIERLVDTLRGGLTVVSSDRAVRTYAEKRMIVTLGSLEFYEFLKSTMAPQEESPTSTALHKFQGSSDIDELMEEGTREVPFKSEDYETFTPHEKKLSKKEKKIDRVIKKL